MIRQEIMKLFMDSDSEELATQHTKDQLIDYHYILYGSYPPSGWCREDIVKSIQKYKNGIDLALVMKPYFLRFG